MGQMQVNGFSPVCQLDRHGQGGEEGPVSVLCSSLIIIAKGLNKNLIYFTILQTTQNE